MKRLDHQTHVRDAVARVSTPGRERRSWLCAMLGLLVWAPAALAGAGDKEVQRIGGREVVPGAIVVKPRGSAQAKAKLSAWIAGMASRSDRARPAQGCVVGRELAGLGLVLTCVAKENHLARLNDLARRSDVGFAAPVYVYKVARAPDDPLYERQYPHRVMGSPAAWDRTTGSASIPIAILDTGVDLAHEDLSSKLRAGYNFWDGNSDARDVHGHGTAVAGAAAAIGNNGLGLAGVAWSNPILPVRIGSPDGSATSTTIAAGMKWAVDNGARVLNCSFGPLQGDQVVEDAARYVRDRGGLVIVAAGNDGQRNGAPASDAMIFISATDESDARAGFSTYGPAVRLSAPGVDIPTTRNGGGYGSYSGTSFAAPLVAGVAALVWSRDPSLSPYQVEDILQKTATDLGPAGPDEWFGHGRVDAARAVGAAGSGSEPAPAQILEPAPGSVLGGSSVLFRWSAGQGVSEYWLTVGSVRGGADYYGRSSGMSLETRVDGLPADGRTVHARIWSLISGSWTYTDASFTAARDASGARARITSPAPGSTLAGSSVLFEWSPADGAEEYWLEVGTAPGRSEYFDSSAGRGLSATVDGLPTDGREIHVRLWWRIGGDWSGHTTDASFVAGEAYLGSSTSWTGR